MDTSKWLEKVESTAGKAKQKVVTTAGDLKGRAESLAGKAKENGVSTAGEIKDKAESATGNAKENVAAATGEIKDKAQSAAGETKEKVVATAGEIKDRASQLAGEAQRKTARLRLLARMQGRAHRLIGSAKETYGRAFDKKHLIAEGKAQKLSGQALQQANR